MKDELHRLLTVPTRQLAREWNLSERDVRVRRMNAIGTPRPIGSRWLPAVGSWGGVRSAREIADLVGTERAVVKDYAKAMGLRTATEQRQRTHAQLAVLLWCDRRRSPRESCRAHGVLVAERTLLCLALEDVMCLCGIGIDAVLQLSAADLEAMWRLVPHPFTTNVAMF